MKGSRKNARIVPLLLAMLIVGGCGYRWKTPYRDDVRTVAVPIFQNKTFQRGVEFSLTKAVANQLELYSPYKIVSRDKADTLLEGEITDVAIKTLSHDLETDVPQEQQMTMTVDFVWKDLRTGRVISERRNIQGRAVYYPSLGEGMFVGSQKGVERLARDVVNEMQADW